MKKHIVILILILSSLIGYSQKKPVKDTVVNLTDTTLLLNVKDMDGFIERTGKLLADNLTKNQWEMVRAALLQEASVTINQVVDRYKSKQLPNKQK